MRTPARHDRPRAITALCLLAATCASLITGCSKPIALRSQGASVRAPAEHARDSTAMSDLQAPAFALARNDASQSPRATSTPLDSSAFASTDRPDAYRPRRIYYTTQENTYTFFRMEGAQFREQRTRVWIP